MVRESLDFYRSEPYLDAELLNRDPLSGELGSHPVATGVGAAATGVVGAALGAAAGPFGAIIGAVVGSVIGGLFGKGTAEAVKPTVEPDFWQRGRYPHEPYLVRREILENYQPVSRHQSRGYARNYPIDPLREERERTPRFEESHWSYDDYQPAYRLGYEAYNRYYYTGKKLDELEPDLRREYESNSRESRLPWDQAKVAVREAWYKAAEQSLRDRTLSS